MTTDGAGVPEGTVTLLSTDLVGSTLLNQELGDRASAAIERETKADALEHVARCGGTIVKDTGDGMMAAFRSARQAVTCARELQYAITRRNHGQQKEAASLRVGLHTGEVLAENGDIRGETVIVTKRIEEIAPPGGIYASDTVYGVLGTNRAELVDRGHFELKGITVPWHLYEVPWVMDESGGILAPNEQTPFVGRFDERTHLIELAKGAREASGSLALIAGEVGVGKTRLTEEVTLEARRMGLLVLEGHCLDMEGSPPFLPLIEQIEQSARIVQSDALREALGENAPEVAKLLPELRQKYPDIPDPVLLPPEQEQRYLLHGVCEFIERAANVQPMLLIFENLQWADESTIRLLLQLAQRIHNIPVLVIGTYRHEEVNPKSPLAGALPDLLRQRLAEELLLQRLTEASIAELLKGRAGTQPPPELVSLVYAETEGNPLFAEEVFRHLHEAGKLLADDGSFMPDISIADTEVPRSVRLLISQRLQNISQDCHLVLTRAAALGHNFDFNLVITLAELDEDALLDALDEAENIGLIRDISSGREAQYAFVNEQFRQTLMAELSTPRRQRLHLRIADTLEEYYGSKTEDHAGEIAHHLYQAGAAADRARTARYLILAGEQARATSAFDEAIQMFEAAETVLPADDSATLANLLFSRGMALRGAAQMEKALATFQEVIDIFPPGDEQDRTINARAQLLLDLYRGHEAVHDLERLLTRAQDTGDQGLELESLLGLGRAYYIISLNESGGGERALERYEQAYKLAQENRDKIGMIRALLPTRHLADYWPEFTPRAISNVEEAVRLTGELSDEDLILDSAQARLKFLTPREAHEPGQALLERLKSRRDPLRLKEHYFWLMWHYRRVGEFTKSVEACDAGIKLADELGANPVQYPTIKALSLICLGRYDEAWEALEQEVAEEFFGQVMREYGLTYYLESMLAFEQTIEQAQKTIKLAIELDRAWMRRGAQNQRVSSLAQLGIMDDQTLAEIEQDLQSLDANISRKAMAEVMLARGSLEHALELVEAAISSAEETGMKLDLIPALELKLRILLGMENFSEALAVADTALEQAIKTNYRSMIWRIQANRARTREAMGDEKGAREDFRAAADTVWELAQTITEPELRHGFETSPLTAPLLSR